MRFTSFLWSDIRNGILRQWPKYLMTFLLFSVFAVLHFLDIRITELSNPEYLSTPPTLGDYFLEILAGKPPFVLSEIPEIFNVPVLWTLMLIWLLFITLYYPYKDLMGMGKHMLVLSQSRTAWWLSKCVWAVLSVLAYAATAAAAVGLFAYLFKAEMSLRISAYLPEWLYFDVNALLSPPWHMEGLLILFVAVAVAMCLVQLLISLVIKPVSGFVLLVVYVVAGTYFQTPWLLGNYLMAARSEYFVRGGMCFSDGLALSLGVVFFAVIVGIFVINEMDILNREQ